MEASFTRWQSIVVTIVSTLSRMLQHVHPSMHIYLCTHTQTKTGKKMLKWLWWWWAFKGCGLTVSLVILPRNSSSGVPTIWRILDSWSMSAVCGNRRISPGTGRERSPATGRESRQSAKVKDYSPTKRKYDASLSLEWIISIKKEEAALITIIVFDSLHLQSWMNYTLKQLINSLLVWVVPHSIILI